jgi:dTDP-4-amino-4,6-dideoxygalactose transaminase
MINLFKVRMSQNVGDALNPVLLSGYIGQGPRVEEFENVLWEELNTTIRPITVNSCTSAIDLALELCEVDSNSEVISTAQTCFASQIGAIHRNAKIRWADIDSETGLIDPISVGKMINEKTKAIIAVNWAGKFADYKSLKSFGIPVIEDAAHTWDSFLDIESKPERGDYICYSFQAIKFLTTSDGGILITPVEKESQARILRWYGLDRTKSESFRCTQNILKTGFKYHMNDICATIGLSNLSEARKSVISHRENAKKLCDELTDLKFAKVLNFDETSSYWIFPILLNEGQNCDNFIEYLKKNGIESSPVHFRNDLYDATIKFFDGKLPGLDSFSERQINIPCGWWLSKEDIDYIIDKIKEYDK